MHHTIVYPFIYVFSRSIYYFINVAMIQRQNIVQILPLNDQRLDESTL